MKRLLLIIVISATFLFTLSAKGLTDELLNYKIYYRLGFLQKQAGRATLCLSPDGDYYKAALYARTEPWADHFYTVRDTLLSTFSPVTFQPTEYHRIAHENSWYGHDIVKFSYIDDNVVGSCQRLSKGKKDKEVKETSLTLTAQGTTVDLLSAFYFIRGIDFQNEQEGASWVLNIFSGKRKELLTINYLGKKKIKIGKKNVDSYNISFKFTSEGGKQTSDPIKAWLSTDSNKIPLKIEGKLSIGKILCVYSE